MSVAFVRSELAMAIIESIKIDPHINIASLLLPADNFKGIFIFFKVFFLLQKWGNKNIDNKIQSTMLNMEKNASSL